MGDKDQAFRWLNSAYQERVFWLEGLKTDFLLDPIRSDPRFAELVRKVGATAVRIPDIPILKEAKAEYAKLK